MSEVAGRIRELRRLHGLTQRDLAEHCADRGMPSLTRGTIAKIESGVRQFVTLQEAAALAGALAIPVNELLPDPAVMELGSGRAAPEGTDLVPSTGLERPATRSVTAYPPGSSWAAAIHVGASSSLPVGCGVVIDERRVLTAASAVTDRTQVLDQLWVAFPLADDPARRSRVAEVHFPGTQHADRASLAMLTLADPVPSGVAGAPLSFPEARDLPGQRWSASAYSLDDGLGRSATGTITSALGYGWVSLNDGDREELDPGFAGSPLWSAGHLSVIGVVVTVDGHGGRALTLHQAELDGLSLRPRSGRPPAASHSGPARPYFFLSYARTPKIDSSARDDPDRWVRKLYRDLCGEIMQMTDAEPGEAGFMSLDSARGADWPSEMASALATCRVFVPLYSRRYFESDNCGREWFAFARREISTGYVRSGQVSAIVPALWTRMNRDAIPEIARSRQYDHAGLGTRYVAEGFYGIMKLSSFRADYMRAVHRLAERIVEVAEQTDIQPDQGFVNLDPEALPASFGPASLSRTAAIPSLQIAVVAPDISALVPERDKLYYGSTPMAWSPYKPLHSRPIAEHAVEIARKCLDADSSITTVAEIRQQAADSRQIPPAMVLVDPWAATIPELADDLRILDEITDPWVSVMIPWNSDDAALNAAENDIRGRLDRLLRHKLEGVPRQCRTAADGIPTQQEFDELMAVMTVTLARRFREGALAFPPDFRAAQVPSPKVTLDEIK